MDAGEVKAAAVVGAGTMGHSIAQVFAQAGIGVSLVDVDAGVLASAGDRIRSNLETLAGSGSVARGSIEDIVSLITMTTDLEEAASRADFITEAVPEVPEIKKDVFARLEKACSQGTVIASNTSGLDIYETVEAERPERLVIAHWFAPPHIIPLVEVVPGPLTSRETVAFTASLMRRLGKEPVVLKGFTRAFIVNKIQNMISLAVFELLGSGLATPEDIDRAVKYSLGIRLPVVGVVQTMDFTGLDLVADVGRSYGMNIPFIAEKVGRGELGAKTSRGIYDYGGRSEAEILEKRDGRYLSMLAHLGSMGAFEPV